MAFAEEVIWFYL